MRIVLFDPSGTTNYCNGLAEALSKRIDVDVIARDNYNYLANENYNLYKWFELSDNTVKYKWEKGFNYIKGYIKTLRLIEKNDYDVFHIQWLLMYKIDIFFLKKIRKKVKKIVYTAHNIIPHVEGDKKYNELKKIYDLVDVIVVHGKASKKELLELFELEPDKVVIQPHGLNCPKKPSYDINEVSSNIKEKIELTRGKIYLYLGVIFEAKGVDRLFRYWEKKCTLYKDDLLVVAGKISEYTDNYKTEEKAVDNISNLLYLPWKINEVDHHYLYDHADIILLPYRHASMSGVIFDAATFSKTILTTAVGCIPEYLENNEDSFVVLNEDREFEKKMEMIQKTDRKQLIAMGEKLNHNISQKYNWEIIACNLIEDVYE